MNKVMFAVFMTSLMLVMILNTLSVSSYAVPPAGGGGNGNSGNDLPDFTADIWINKISWTYEYKFQNVGATWDSQAGEGVFIKISAYSRPSEDVEWNFLWSKLWGPDYYWPSGATFTSKHDDNNRLPGRHDIIKTYFKLVAVIDTNNVVTESDEENNIDIVYYSNGIIENEDPSISESTQIVNIPFNGSGEIFII